MNPDTDRSRANEAALRVARRALDECVRARFADARPLFVTISGAHIYGFPSADSDIDLRGAHVLPLPRVLGLGVVAETIEVLGERVDGVEVDCVSHDLKKYLALLVKKNGYVLEQIHSPLVVEDGGCLEELRELSLGAVTRHVVHHYRGFFRRQYELVEDALKPTVKAVLYLFRVAMTGVRLLRAGEVLTDLLELNDADWRLDFIPELVARKIAGEEKGLLAADEREHLLGEALRLDTALQEAFQRSTLPEQVENLAALDEFLVRMRLATE